MTEIEAVVQGLPPAAVPDRRRDENPYFVYLARFSGESRRTMRGCLDRIAALIGVTDATVKSMLAEMKARQRAESVGVHLNGSVAATPLRILGQASEKLNDEPFRAVASLAQDTGMGPSELREVIKQMHAAKSDDGAVGVVDEQRKARREQIAEYRASGKSKPPPAAKLRQRLGFILEYESSPRDLLELNPEVVAKHREAIEKSIAVLQAVLAAAEAKSH